MLDKIQNINAKEKYKSGLKIPSSNLYIVQKNEYDKHSRKDSAMFSPLAKLLSKINWKILAIEYPTEDEMLLHFAVDDLEFITLIDFNELYKNEYHEFSIFKSGVQNERNVDYEAKILVNKKEISVLETPEEININNLLKLFSRISYQNFTTIIQPNLLNEMLLGIDIGIYNELNYILKVIYTFITTKFSNRIKNNIILKSQGNIPIIIMKTAIIDTE